MDIAFQNQASMETVAQQNQSKHYKKLGQKVAFSLSFHAWLKFQEPDSQPYFLTAVLQEVLAQGFALGGLMLMVCAVQLALSQW